MSSAASNPPPAGAPTGARAHRLRLAAQWVDTTPRTATGRPCGQTLPEWLSDNDGGPTPGLGHLRQTSRALDARADAVLRAAGLRP